MLQVIEEKPTDFAKHIMLENLSLWESFLSCGLQQALRKQFFMIPPGAGSLEQCFMVLFDASAREFLLILS